MPVALLLVATLVGCGARSEDSDDAASPVRAGEGYVQEYAPDDRPAVEDFEGTLLDGDEVSEADLEGQISVINVWGSWCAPCRAEAPTLRRLALAYEARGVGFLGLNVRDNTAAAQAFERRYDIPYPSITSEDSPKVSLAFGGQLAASAVPTTLVLNGDRRVAARVTGEVSGATLRALLDAALLEEDEA